MNASKQAQWCCDHAVNQLVHAGTQYCHQTICQQAALHSGPCIPEFYMEETGTWSPVLWTKPNTACLHQFPDPVNKEISVWNENKSKWNKWLFRESRGFRDISPSTRKLWLTDIDITIKICNSIQFFSTSASLYFQRKLHTKRSNKVCSANS